MWNFVAIMPDRRKNSGLMTNVFERTLGICIFTQESVAYVNMSYAQTSAQSFWMSHF